jgi:hypothetical protein
MMTGCGNCEMSVWLGSIRKAPLRSTRRRVNGASGFWMRLITHDPRRRPWNWTTCIAPRECVWGTACRCSPNASAREVGHCHWKSAGFRRSPTRLLTGPRKLRSSSSGRVGRPSEYWSWTRTTLANHFSIRFSSWASRFSGEWLTTMSSLCRRRLIRVSDVRRCAGERSSSMMREPCPSQTPKMHGALKMADG